MGFMDKIKGAMKMVSGGAAKVQIEYPLGTVFLGDAIPVKVTVTSTGGEVKSKGIFVDLRSIEEVSLRTDNNEKINRDKTMFEQAFPVAPEFLLTANETKIFEGRVSMPNQAAPTYRGAMATHEWTIRGRVDAKGNDPDSGWLKMNVAQKQ